MTANDSPSDDASVDALTARMSSVLHQAAEEARRQGQARIGTEHILLALIFLISFGGALVAHLQELWRLALGSALAFGSTGVRRFLGSGSSVSRLGLHSSGDRTHRPWRDSDSGFWTDRLAKRGARKHSGRACSRICQVDSPRGRPCQKEFRDCLYCY